MNEREWCEATFADLLVEVDHTPECRKSDLLAVACSRVQPIWSGLSNSAREEIEGVERAADDPRSPTVHLAGTDAYNLTWLGQDSDEITLEVLEPLHFLFHDCGSTYQSGWFNLPDAIECQWTAFLRDIFGNPFRPVAFDPSWRTFTVAALAEQMYGSRDLAPMPVLADALQDAGCDHPDILAHCRGDGPHVRGCWVVDLILGKQ